MVAVRTGCCLWSLCVFTVCTGSQDGTVHVWAGDSGERVAMLDGGHAGPTHCVQFNPKLMTMATACNSMVSDREGVECVGVWSETWSRYLSCPKLSNLYHAGLLATNNGGLVRSSEGTH